MILLLFFLNIAHAPQGAKGETESAVCTEMKVSDADLRVACQIERTARDHGIKNREFIKGLLVNAFAESSLDPNAVSPGKKSFGVFQLHIDGMGYGMSKDEMTDVRTSSKVIIEFINSSKIRTEKLNAIESTKIICKKVLRPENKNEKALERVKILKKIFKNS